MGGAWRSPHSSDGQEQAAARSPAPAAPPLVFLDLAHDIQAAPSKLDAHVHMLMHRLPVLVLRLGQPSLVRAGIALGRARGASHRFSLDELAWTGLWLQAVGLMRSYAVLVSCVSACAALWMHRRPKDDRKLMAPPRANRLWTRRGLRDQHDAIAPRVRHCLCAQGRSSLLAVARLCARPGWAR